MNEWTIEIFLKENIKAKLVFEGRKLYWADDVGQWEVYQVSKTARGIDFLYKGQDLDEALRTLKNGKG